MYTKGSIRFYFTFNYEVALYSIARLRKIPRVKETSIKNKPSRNMKMQLPLEHTHDV